MSTVWYVVKRIAHAVVWWLAIGLAAAPVSWVLGLGLSHWSADFGPFFATVITLPIIIYVWILALSRRWSATWPVIFLSVVLWPFGFTWVGMIGLGKLAIHAVGRGGTSAGSDLDEQEVVGARPRGLVEYASYD